jgi:PAS domain S-box-containing protein
MAPELVHAIVEQCPDAMIFADREGTIRLWNRAAEALFGYSTAEALGASLDVIIPERLRAAHWAGYRRAIAAGETKYGSRVLTTRSARKDGGKLYVELSFALVKDADGMVIGALATARDGTERYLAGRSAPR